MLYLLKYIKRNNIKQKEQVLMFNNIMKLVDECEDFDELLEAAEYLNENRYSYTEIQLSFAAEHLQERMFDVFKQKAEQRNLKKHNLL